MSQGLNFQAEVGLSRTPQSCLLIPAHFTCGVPQASSQNEKEMSEQKQLWLMGP